MRVVDHRGAQHVVGQVVGTAHAFVNGVVQAAGKAFQPHIHAQLEKHVNDARVLANGAVASGTHFAVGQNLCNGVFGRSTLFALVGPRQVGNVVRRVVVADVLQSRSNRFNEVFLLDGGGHGIA